MKKYLLRNSSSPHYLSNVADDGLKATFVTVVDDAMNFTAEQRDEFKIKNAHIKGRWVLLDVEKARVPHA